MTAGIENRFELLHNTPSDINVHLPIMRAYGTGCLHITEFGVRTGVSTSAWLASYPVTLKCYDRDVPPNLHELEGLARDGGIEFVFCREPDTGNVRIGPTDLLFIDTTHCEAQARRELENSEAVRKHIILHDTNTYGWGGDDGKMGLRHAMMDFLLRWPKRWTVDYHSDECCGLTVLRRLS